MTQAPPQPRLNHGSSRAQDPAPQSDWQTSARVFNYHQAANPMRPGLTEAIPYHRWPAAVHQGGPTAVIPLDISEKLGCDASPATSPALAANFLRILGGEGIKASAEATSSVFYVLRGHGRLIWGGRQLEWRQGDLFSLPCGDTPLLQGSTESILYWVHDAPLLRHLGVQATTPRFTPAHYPASLLEEELNTLMGNPSALKSNRLSLLLGNADCAASRTVTHTLWAMLGIVPPGALQPPHRHQSVALDLIIDCDPGCYTLVGTDLTKDGGIANPTRIDWEPGAVFVTPPGHWHAHVNKSERMARLMPIQDAGLHTYLRSLDIRFSGGLRLEE